MAFRRNIEVTVPATPTNASPPPHAGATPTLRELFLTFLRLGATAFGGPAMLPVVRAMVVERKGWMDEAAFRSGVALCQAVPGATVMQVASYVGLRLRGTPGMLAGFFGFTLPAFLMITLLSAMYWKNRELPAIMAAFIGLKAVTVALMVSGLLDFGKRYLRMGMDWVIGAGVCGLTLLGVHPIVPVLAAAGAGVLAYRDGDATPVGAPGNAPGGPLNLPGSLAALRGLLAGLAGVAVALAVLGALRPDLFALAVSMLRTDLVAFGGALAALPVMRHEVVHLRGWMSDAAFLDGVAIGQVTPGPIILTAAFIGWRVDGLVGSVVAGLAIFTPSLFFMLGAERLVARIEHSRIYRRAVRATLAGFTGLLGYLAITVAQALPPTPLPAAIGVAAFAALRAGVDVLYVVGAGALASWLLA
ncbi:chromate efflux transporter [Nitratidesulfovibrio sp. HK-II]|uniref:chromate efflux transporter n=1 Tax=Nitratidesulfovibrio sp. HK-II TaxID=2009266 RepID=UPI000E2E5108|nr:chromate efflux transporter [Nitratidesulfovibrio sp. HK-II]GBO97850.1 chromate transport protein ChrA [Nitratidesulfovibrio sp. HK-II]